ASCHAGRVASSCRPSPIGESIASDRAKATLYGWARPPLEGRARGLTHHSTPPPGMSTRGGRGPGPPPRPVQAAGGPRRPPTLRSYTPRAAVRTAWAVATLCAALTLQIKFFAGP